MPAIPPEFRVFFWDTDINILDPLRNKRAIIERLLEFGDENAYRWLFKTYSDAEIETVVRKSRRISPRTGTMLANFYNIPRGELRCLRKTSLPKHFLP